MRNANQSIFAVLCGFFAGSGVCMWGGVLGVRLSKLLTGSYSNLFMHGFRPTNLYWIALTVLLGGGSFAGGYVAARIGNAARFVHAGAVGVLAVVPLVIIREHPALYLIPPVCALAASALVLPVHDS